MKNRVKKCESRCESILELQEEIKLYAVLLEVAPYFINYGTGGFVFDTEILTKFPILNKYGLLMCNVLPLGNTIVLNNKNTVAGYNELEVQFMDALEASEAKTIFTLGFSLSCFSRKKLKK